MSKRHPSLLKLTPHLSEEEFADWVRMYSVETVQDSEKRYFSPEEIQDFEHESSLNGREFNRLDDLKKKVSELILKGTEEEVKLTIPPTIGTKLLNEQRRQNDDLIEKGFELIEIEVFGIVNHENETMEYFSLEGELMPKRTRPLTPKEKHKHLGMFQKVSRQGPDLVDEGSGEVLGRASNQ